MEIHGAKIKYEHRRLSEQQVIDLLKCVLHNKSTVRARQAQKSLTPHTVRRWLERSEPVSQYGGLTFAEIELDGCLWWARAQCSYLDQFSRSMGRRIAGGRLVKTLYRNGILEHDEYRLLRRQVQKKNYAMQQVDDRDKLLKWIVEYVVEEHFSTEHLQALVKIVGLFNDSRESEAETFAFADNIHSHYQARVMGAK